MAWIGPIGGLVEVRCPAALAPSTSRPTSYRTTLGGVRKAQVSQRTQHGQQVALSFTRPQDVANLYAIVEGEFGAGPFWWVDPWATHTNLLAPRASMLEVGTWSTDGVVVESGAVALPGGGCAGRSLSLANPAGTVFFPRYAGGSDNVPVLPGKPVTGSVYALGSTVTVRVQWLDAAGTAAGSVSAQTSSPAGLTRCSVTAVPPSNAVACYVAVTGASILARPAVTWTDGVLPWHVGQGMPRVVIDAVAGDVVAAWDGLQGQTATFAVTEVG
jgi:hypothetical protein